MLVGVMSGAVTNTPGLGAAQQALMQTGADNIPDIGIGYAIAYPFGIVGIILTMVIMRRTLNINLHKEIREFNKEKHPEEKLPEKINILVTNPLIFNKTIREITDQIKPDIVISRILQKGNLIAPGPDTIVDENDVLLVVAQKINISSIVQQIGVISGIDISTKSGNLISRRILVTNKSVFGKQLGSLMLRTKYNINITRVYRSGIELVASHDLRLQMGDKLTVVGDEGSIEKVITQLGNSIKRLDEPNLIPLFIGILLGILLGSIPFRIPGIANPIKLGLAGGPLTPSDVYEDICCPTADIVVCIIPISLDPPL